VRDEASEADDQESEPNRALRALDDAAKSTGSWITETASTMGEGVATGASAVGSGVASAAAAVSRPFRAVDVDGDGIPDEPQALAAVKGLGGALAGATGAAGGRVAGLFKSRKRDMADASMGEPEE
jgi:hypothetical protein